MRFRLLVLTLCICALATACNGVDSALGAPDTGPGHVTAITLDPEVPGAGQKVRVAVDLADPYLYPGIPGAGPRVTLQVTGGSVQGLDWNGELGGTGGWQPVDGPSIIAYPAAAMYWTLPDEPGTYKLTVGFDGNTKTKRVEVK